MHVFLKGAISGDVQLTSLSGTYCGMRQSLICTARNTLDVEVFISDLPLQRISFNGDSEIRVNDHYFITVTEKVLQVINTITTVNFTVMIEYTVDKDTNTDKINCTADACSASERVTLDSKSVSVKTNIESCIVLIHIYIILCIYTLAYLFRW